MHAMWIKSFLYDQIIIFTLNGEKNILIQPFSVKLFQFEKKTTFERIKLIMKMKKFVCEKWSFLKTKQQKIY